MLCVTGARYKIRYMILMTRLFISSEDEISQWLDGTPQQKKAIRRRSIGLPSDSSEDEFEKEMMTNLNSAMTQKFPMSEQACKSKLQQGMSDES